MNPADHEDKQGAIRARGVTLGCAFSHVGANTRFL